jgi:hypothetical protein
MLASLFARKEGKEIFKTTITLTMGVTDEMYSHKEMHPHYPHRKWYDTKHSSSTWTVLLLNFISGYNGGKPVPQFISSLRLTCETIPLSHDSS